MSNLFDTAEHSSFAARPIISVLWLNCAAGNLPKIPIVTQVDHVSGEGSYLASLKITLSLCRSQTHQDVHADFDLCINDSAQILFLPHRSD